MRFIQDVTAIIGVGSNNVGYVRMQDVDGAYLNRADDAYQFVMRDGSTMDVDELQQRAWGLWWLEEMGVEVPTVRIRPRIALSICYKGAAS